MSIVWILGAGFSKPLGAPLLKDLLWPEALRNIHYTYDEKQYPKLRGLPTTSAHWLYQYGTRYARGHRDMDFKGVDMEGAQFWENPEDYLDYLEVAAQNDLSRAARIVRDALRQFWGKALQPVPVEEVSVAARRLVAAECSAFLEGIDTESERCMPYVRWANTLVKPGDSVITFNYDLVIERVANRGGPKFMVPVNKDDLAGCRGLGDRVPVYKLHGSVDWRWNRKDGRIEHPGDDHFALTCDDKDLAIASPGPLKLTMTKELDLLWEHAMTDLRRATQIVFVGYGFPQTDAYAKRRLIEAIRENVSEGLHLHIVLGPDLRAPPVVRLDGMLRHAISKRVGRYSPRGLTNYGMDKTLKFYQLTIHPLFAEDFFTVVEREALTEPPTPDGPLPI